MIERSPDRPALAYPLIDLVAVDLDLLRRIDAQAHSATADLQDLDPDVLARMNAFACFSCQYQHVPARRQNQ